MNRIKYLSFFFALAMILSACSRETGQQQPVTSSAPGGTSQSPSSASAEQRDKALVRVVNAMPGNKDVDVFAGETKVFTDVAFKSVTPYKEITDTGATFKLVTAGQDAAQPLAENREALMGGRHYTAVAVASTDKDEPAELRVFTDDLVPPDSGKAKVRIIHAAQGVKEVDVFAKDKNDPLFGGVNFQTETRYQEVDPMNTTIQVRPQNEKRTLVNLPNVQFEAGKIYTLIVTGTGNRLEVIRVEDRIG